MKFATAIVLVSLLLAAPLFAGCFSDDKNDGGGGNEAMGPQRREFDIDLKTVLLPLYPVTKRSGGGAESDPVEADHRMTIGIGFKLQEDSTSSVPGPELRVREGDVVSVNFINNDGFGFNHTIHWHGVRVPWKMDGVPYVSQLPVVQDKSYLYEFVAKDAGTYWYHCHVDATHHVDLGMYGAFIVEPANPEKEPEFDREQTLFFDEWDNNHLHSAMLNHTLFADPSGDPEAYIERLLTLYRDSQTTDPNTRKAGSGTTHEKRDWWPETPPPYDPNYNTFTINSRAFPFTRPIDIAEGETLKLRLINAGGMVHAIHIHGHVFDVTHKDGHLLPAAYQADTILIGPGERYDVLVHGDNPGVWEFHCHMAGHTSNDNIWPGGMMTMLAYEGFDSGTGGHVGHGSFGSGPDGELVAGDYAWAFAHD